MAVIVKLEIAVELLRGPFHMKVHIGLVNLESGEDDVDGSSDILRMQYVHEGADFELLDAVAVADVSANDAESVAPLDGRHLPPLAVDAHKQRATSEESHLRDVHLPRDDILVQPRYAETLYLAAAPAGADIEFASVPVHRERISVILEQFPLDEQIIVEAYDVFHLSAFWVK